MICAFPFSRTCFPSTRYLCAGSLPSRVSVFRPLQTTDSVPGSTSFRISIMFSKRCRDVTIRESCNESSAFPTARESSAYNYGVEIEVVDATRPENFFFETRCTTEESLISSKLQIVRNCAYISVRCINNRVMHFLLRRLASSIALALL